MSELFLGLIALGIALAFAFLVPLLSFVRASRALRKVEKLGREIEALKKSLNDLTTAVRSTSPAAPAEKPANIPVWRPAEAEPPVAEPHPAIANELQRLEPLAAREGEPVSPKPREGGPAAPKRSEGGPDALETRIGSRWLLYVGVALVIAGAGYLVKHAVEHDWITARARVLAGVLGGLALLTIGSRFAKAGYALYGQILMGGGIAVLYVATYAALAIYALVSQTVAFVSLVIVTLVAAWLADRHRSQGLALMAVVGGFVTPFLVGEGPESPLPLFTYEAILIGGTMILAHRRGWPWLNLASLWLTALTVKTWTDTHDVHRWYITIELFLTLYTAMFLYILNENRRVTHHLAPLVTLCFAFTPIAYHFASLALLFPHPAAWLVYLIAIGGITVVAAGYLKQDGARLVAWLAVALPLLGWVSSRPAPEWFIGTLTALATIYLLHLAVHMQALAQDRQQFRREEIALLHLNSLWFFASLSLLIELQAPRALGAVMGGVAVWHLVLAQIARRFHDEAPWHYIALSVVFGAAALTQVLDGRWVTVGWSMGGTALVWLGLRSGRDWLRLAGAVMLGLATLRLLTDLSADAPVNYVPLFNARAAACAFLVALLYWLGVAHRRVATTARTYDRSIAVLVLAAHALTLVLATVEINAFFATRSSTSLQLELTRRLALSIVWASYAVGLVALGIARSYKPIRYFAIALLALTVGKVVLVDLATLDRFYQVMSVVGLGILLLIASFLYQRFKPEAS